MTIGLGLRRAKEPAGFTWADVYETDGRVRKVVHLKVEYTKGGQTRDVFMSSPALRRMLERYGERDWLGSARASSRAVVPTRSALAQRIPRGASRGSSSL
jgi:hypothetical protein